MLEFLKAALSGNGEASSNRLCLFIVIMSLMCWASIAVYRTGAIPEIPDSWIYVIGIFTTASLGGKVTEAYKVTKTSVPTEEAGA